jgi:AAHS family 4-hydroxybenzoate transporter-like MFS transporter
MRKISIGETIDGSPFSSFQFFLCSLCCLVTLSDGFDLSIISVALPKMAEALGVKPHAFGPALVAGQLGPFIGAIIFGMLSDRLGRKWVLIASGVIFGLFTLSTALVSNVNQLAVYRFLAGIGLGGAVPLALALGTEYAPGRVKSTFATILYAGMPLGAVIAGLAAIWLIPNFGWPSLFVLGGIIPLLLTIVLIPALPESLHFLVRRGKRDTKVRKIVAKIAPAIASDSEVEFVSSEKKVSGVSFKLLFTEGRASITVLIWIAMISALYGAWSLMSWAAVLLHQCGATLTQYAVAGAASGTGAALAMIIMGRLMDKLNPFKVLAVGYIASFFCLVAFGMFAGSSFVMCSLSLSSADSSFPAVRGPLCQSHQLYIRLQ